MSKDILGSLMRAHRTDFLKLVSTIIIPATSGKFIAKEKFSRDTSGWAKVKISHLGGIFITRFLSGDGKTEDPISEQALRYAKLRKAATNKSIISELGGEAKAETTLSVMFFLMEKQGKGQDGVLANNSYANIFYIKDIVGVLWTIFVCWRDDGWDISASSIESPCRWSKGNQVFSRNSVLEYSSPIG